MRFLRLMNVAKILSKTRWLDENKLTLHDLATKYGISAERVRQLENAALKKIKDAISLDV